MKPSQKSKVLLLIVASAAVVSMCVYGQASSPTAEPASGGRTVVDKCKIDLSSPQDCTLSKGNDERAVFVNNSRSDLYVCFNPKNDPFEAYAFYVPASKERKSGKVKDESNPPSSFEYFVSTKNCVWPTPIRTNPKIIIGN